MAFRTDEPAFTSPPHAGQPVVVSGPPMADAGAVMILAHGRGASPGDILSLGAAIANDQVTYVAPAAAGNTWYPFSFLADTEQNEPGLSSGLGVLRALVTEVERRGVPADRIVVSGFSQGGCLASEYSVRHSRRLGGVIVFSGGLVGPPGTTWDTPGGLAGTPVFLGCSDVDPHIPLTRVEETEEVFHRMGGDVTKRIYPGMGHLVNDDEIAFARDLLGALVG